MFKTGFRGVLHEVREQPHDFSSWIPLESPAVFFLCKNKKLIWDQILWTKPALFILVYALSNLDSCSDCDRYILRIILVYDNSSDPMLQQNTGETVSLFHGFWRQTVSMDLEFIQWTLLDPHFSYINIADLQNFGGKEDLFSFSLYFALFRFVLEQSRNTSFKGSRRLTCSPWSARATPRSLDPGSTTMATSAFCFIGWVISSFKQRFIIKFDEECETMSS